MLSVMVGFREVLREMSMVGGLAGMLSPLSKETSSWSKMAGTPQMLDSFSSDRSEAKIQYKSNT